MSDKRQWIPALGLLGTVAVAVYMVVQLNAQTAPAGADFSNAAVAEVRDSQGQVILRGQFAPAADDGDDGDEIERKATLQPTGVDADAAGEAEVEIQRSAPATQEIEFSIRNVQPGAAFTFVIDGRDVATATADQRGRAEVEVD
jgi:hypothetical protein